MRAFVTFLFAYVLSQFYRSFLAVIAPELSHDLALDPQALANLQSFWVLGFVLMQIPVGYVLDRFGPRLTGSLLFAPAIPGAFLFASAHSAAMLYTGMFLIGVGCGAPFMSALYIFGRTHPPKQFALLTSWLIGLGSSGNLLAAAPLAWAASTYGWRSCLSGLGFATALACVLVALLIRNPPHLGVNAQGGIWRGLKSILKLRDLWPLLPLTFVSYAVLLAERGLWAGPFFASVYDLGPVPRGKALFVMALAIVIGALVYGPLDRFFNTRKWVAAGGTLITVIAFATLALVPLDVGGATAVLAVIGCAAMTYGVIMAHGRALFPEALLGRGITFLNMLFIAGVGVLQLFSGAYMKSMVGLPPALAYSRLHLTFAILLAAALVIYLFAKDQKPVATPPNR